MDDNRRSFFRVSMRLAEARATGISEGRASRFIIRLIDLSAGGSLILSPRSLKVSDAVRLHLPSAPGHDAIDLPGRIVRTELIGKEWRVAVQFTSLSDADRDRIVRRVMYEELRQGVVAAGVSASSG